MDRMQNRMGVTCAKMLALAVLVLAARATAGEYPLSGEFLHLASRVTGMPGIRLGATGDARPRGRPECGSRSHRSRARSGRRWRRGADAPAVPLPGENWRALGDPPGSRGFRYFDSSGRFGVRKVSLRFGTRVSLSVRGGGPGWPYQPSGVPRAVTVLFHVGDETFCASFGTFKRGRSGAMCATHNPPPATCRYDS
jgi:hypothetical protein